MATTDTRTKLLDAAQQLVQLRGFNAFSYKDLAAQVGIRTASIHYHFEAKADLAQALMARYIAALEEALATIDRNSKSNRAKLKAFIDVYRSAQDQGALCLCGSLASDAQTLPQSVHTEISSYIKISEDWVAQKLRDGVRRGEFSVSGRVGSVSTSLIASLQGALIVARARNDGSAVVDCVERSLFASLKDQ